MNAPERLNDTERARSALWALDAGADRHEWARIGMAAKAAGLEFDDFNDWSATAGNYGGQADTRTAWNSFKEGDGINAGTLFFLARKAGWIDNSTEQKQEPKGTKKDPSDFWKRGTAAPADHPYIQRKGGKADGLRVVSWPLRGWADFKGQTLEGWLMVPVFGADGGLASIQFIGPNGGEKLNAPGCRMAGTFTLGQLEQGAPAYIVEGIGHAWSIHALTGKAAVVSFGAGNIEKAAAAIKAAGAAPVIVPDRGKEDQARAAALRQGCACAVLPGDLQEGADINDLHLARGAEAVLAVLSSAAPVVLPERKAAPVPANDNTPQPLDKPLEHPEAIYHPDHIAWKRNKETGEWEFQQAKGTSENLLRLMRAYGVRIRYNELSRDVEISVNGKLPTGDLARNRSLSMVEDLCRLNDYPYTAAAGHLDNLAAREAYNPALEWVKSRQWDGGDHIRALFDCLTLTDQGMSEISWTLFRKWFLGAVAILSGKANKFEHVLVLVDPMGGLGKTRFFNTLCPKEFQADGVTLKTDDKDSVLQVVSKWIVELGEIGATFSKSDIESLKAFLSRESDELRPAYARSSNRYQRRTAFFGSVNNVQFLMDDTNNRRFWPVQVSAVNYQHKVDVQQAWAEALARVERGEAWHLDQDENRAIGEHNEAFRSKDFIEERILSLYDTNEYRCRYVSASDVLEEIGVRNPKQTDTRKASTLLRKLFPHKVSRGLTVYHMPACRQDGHRLAVVGDRYGDRPY